MYIRVELSPDDSEGFIIPSQAYLATLMVWCDKAELWSGTSIQEAGSCPQEAFSLCLKKCENLKIISWQVNTLTSLSCYGKVYYG